MDEELLKAYVPSSFGGSGKAFDVEAQIEQARRQVPGNENKQKTNPPDSDDNDDSNDSDDGSDDDDDEDDEYPVSHEVVLKTHDRAVTTITVDSAGGRMITGSTDCTLKFHDFASMAPNTIRAFKSLDPTATKSSATSEVHPIHVAKFNHGSGNQLLCVTATPQARILSRDGDVLTEFNKGDMYLRDMNMTKGHISEITSGTWHPLNYDVCVTAGTDSTLRIWDVNVSSKQKDVIVHKSKAAGSAGRSRMTAVAWGSEVDKGNSLLVSAALDGSLLMWGGQGPYHRPSAEIRDAHSPDTWTSGIDISADGRLVVTRGGDDTVKLWDTRKFKTAVNTTAHPSTSAQHPTSNIIFSPNASSVLTGSPTGDLHILNPATLRPDLITPISPSAALITVTWHAKLNQILTGSANATTHILFNPRTSITNRGALAILSKPPKRRHIDDDATFTTNTDTSLTALSGDALSSSSGAPLHHHHNTSSSNSNGTAIKRTGLTQSGKSRDPMRPHMPAQTPFAKSAPDAQHIRQSIPLSTMREEDPREALLKYADKARDDPLFTRAWAKTQPKTIYANVNDGEDDGDGDDNDDDANNGDQSREKKRIKRF